LVLHRRRLSAVAVLAAIVTVAATSCAGGSPSPKPTASPIAGLPDLARARGIALGAGVNEARMDRPRYRTLVVNNFTSITPQNAFKWEFTEPARGRFDFSKVDPLVQFAVDKHLRVRGCCLAWYLQNPKWLTSGTFTPAQAKAIFRAHIKAVVGRYQGKVAQWDVVNEVFHISATGTAVPFNSVWLKTMGIDYVAEAFRAAREADPNALLFANEFGNEGPGPHFDAFYNLVRKLKAQGVPIDGVGLQMHRGLQHPTAAEVALAMQKYAALGLRVEITEMDLPLTVPPDQPTLQRQGLLFRQMTATCLRVAACTGVTFWGVDDGDRYGSLVRRNRGSMTMFDQSGGRKPAYSGVVAALLNATGPPTRLSPGKPAG
jgi:endo-1,4-beta-xylanase